MTRFVELGRSGSQLPVPRPIEIDSVDIPASRPDKLVGIDLRRLFSVLRRRMRLIIGVALAVMAAVTAVTLLTPPQYRATAEIMLDRRTAKVTNASDVLTTPPADSAAVDTEVEVLKSMQLAERVVRSLRLDQDREFNPKAAAGPGAPLSGKQLQRVVETVRRRLEVSRSGLTYVINVGFESRRPATAAAVANEFARLYLVQQVDDKVAATQTAASWLEGRLLQLRRQVTADEQAVQQFKIANNLMSAQGTTLTEQELSTYNQSLAQADAQVAEDQARLDAARRQLAQGSGGSDVGEALSSPTIEQLKQQRAEASRKVAILRTSFQDSYPELQKARNELADIDAQIQAETNLIISSLVAKANMSKRRAEAIASSVGGAKGQLASSNRASVGLSELERNAQASRTLYESYLARYKETSSQVGLAQADAQMVSRAAVPGKPSSPNIPLNLLAGAMLAMGAGLGAAALAELLDAGLATSADVEKRLNVRYLGAIPLLRTVAAGQRRLSPIEYVVEKPLSGFSESFRCLLGAIVHGPNPVAVRTVAVTSALPGEGKTTTAICLARAAALQGYSVVLVDCDLRRRSLDRVVGEAVKIGLLEVLAGHAELDQALVKDTASTDVDVLPLSNAPTSPKDVFGGAAMDRLLVELQHRYDLVVLDTAPVVPVADSRVLAQKADFVVLVARWRRTPYQAIQGALHTLAGNGVEVGGIVLNQVDMQQQVRHGYGDVAYYFNTYRKYYVEN